MRDKSAPQQKPLVARTFAGAIVAFRNTSHIEQERFFVVAHDNNVIFTDAELTHIAKCNRCIEQWLAHIRDLLRKST